MRTMRKIVCVIFFVGFIYSSIGDPLPNVVRQCGNTNVKISETLLDTVQLDDYQILFVSSDNQIVFARTTDGNVYRSGDEGTTWTKQTVPEIMPNIDTVTSGINRIFNWESKEKKIMLYLLSNDLKEALWVSSDGGLSYTYNTMPSGVNWLSPHPLYAGMVLAKRVASNQIEVWICRQSSESPKWTKLVGPLYDADVSWNKFPNIDPNRIYLLQYETNRNNGTIVYSDDFFVTTTKVALDRVNSWKIFTPNNFVAITCADNICSSRELYLSEDGGKTFHLSTFPEIRKETPEELNFYVWELAEDTIWTYVQRSLGWGDIFHSTSAHKNFTLALQFSKEREFTKFNGLDGIYVANQFLTQGGIPEADNRVHSLITYNRGSSWSVLKAPERDSKGQPLDCKISEGCSLHIHGYGHQFSYFYSISKAPGLMIASGNLGVTLEDREDETNTYISFDGGVTWEEVTKGGFVPEIGDMGGVIVMVQESGLTNQILYTVNDGDEWITCNFTDQPLDVTNIRVSQGWDSRRFVLYGQRVINGSNRALIAQLDFTAEFTDGKCTSSDFDDWSPTDDNKNCVMGVKTNYKKRKQGKKCYLGEDYNSQDPTHEPCPCTASDYECNHCFYRPSLSSPCYLECDVPNLPPRPSYCDTNITSYYETDLGYRRIDNDECNEKLPGSIVPKARIDCTYYPTNPLSPGSGNSISNGLGAIPIVIGLVILFMGASGGLWYLYNHNESFNNFVSYTLGISSNVVVHYEEQGQSLTSTVDDEIDE